MDLLGCIIYLIAVFFVPSSCRSPPLCEYKGLYYYEGEYMEDKSRCAAFVCERAKLRLVTKGCRLNDECLMAGEQRSPRPCVTYHCQSNRRRKSKLVVTAGCEWKGNCKRNRDTWMEDCFKFRCEVKSNQANVTVVTKGCTWSTTEDGKCYNLGYEKKKNCTTFQCQEDQFGAVGFKVKYPGCPKVGLRGCANVGQSWTVRKTCLSYTCLEVKDDDQTVVGSKVEGAKSCRFGKKCYKVGADVVVDKCNTLRCWKNKKGHVRLQIGKIGCEYDGTCKKYGEVFTDKCNRYRCQVNTSPTSMRPFFHTQNGCSEVLDPNKCRGVGEMWTELVNNECIQYRCTKKGRNQLSSKGACLYKGTCLRHGEEIISDKKTCICNRGVVNCGITHVKMV